MKIHEYQAKTLFREAGIPAPGGILAVTPDAAAEAARALGLPVVLKAQVHTGGRGKAGGVQVVSTLADVAPTAARILALTIQGLPVRGILVTPAVDIASEVYLSLLVDRSTRETVFIGCAEGGVDIEQTARETPGKILRLPVEPDRLVSLEGDASTAAFARRLFLDEEQARQATAIMARMARLFVEKDCSLIEINPLVVTGSGDVLALDAKVLLDDNALFRHPELAALREKQGGLEQQLHQAEERAAETARDLKKAQYELDVAKEQQRQAESRMLTLEGRKNHYDVLTESLEASCGSLRAEAETITARTAADRTRAQSAQETIDRCEREVQALRAEAGEKLAGQSELLTRSGDLSQKITEHKSALAALQAERESALRSREDLAALRADMEADRAGRGELAEKFRRSNEDAQAEIARRTEQAQALRAGSQ